MINGDGTTPIHRTTPINRAINPGESLRRLRMRLGFTTRKVAELSRTVAAEHGNSDFSLSHARLVQIENEESIPSIHKLFTLSCVYGVAVQDLFSLFFNPQAAHQLHASMPVPNTHLSSLETRREPVTLPLAIPLRPTPRASTTDVLSNMIQAWGQAPVSPFQQLDSPKALYGFIGLSDLTMDPLIPPGSVVQIEECRKIDDALPYRTESDRPIYFLESRSGYLCSWCAINGRRLFSIPHPLSPCRPQVFDFPSEVEVVGRVTGLALRLSSGTRKASTEAGVRNSTGMINECERATAG